MSARIGALGLVALLCVLLGVGSTASAARLHVLPGGTRTSGPSTPGEWSAANCYATLGAAGLAAADGDSILLSHDEHPLDVEVELPRALLNRSLDTGPDSCRVVLQAAGGLRVDPSVVSTTVRGLSFVTTTPAATAPALRVTAPAGPGHVVEIDSCTFGGLRGALTPAAGGAAINAIGGVHPLSLVLHATRFSDNSAGGAGGAVYVGDGIDATVDDCRFERNEARWDGVTVYGGAVAVFADATGSSLTIDGSHFVDNVSWGPAGALYVVDAPLTLRDTEIRGSRSAFGGVTKWSAGAGVFLRRAGDDPQPITLLAERCDFVDNRGDLSLGIGAGDGGGMMIRGSDTSSPIEAVIVDCLFQENFNDQGAGLYVGRSVNATIERSLFLDNTAQSNGGGAYKGGALATNLGETALFSWCVFARNRAGFDANGDPVSWGGWGGGFTTRRYPRAEFHHCSFVDNVAGVNSGKGDALFFWAEDTTFYDPLMRSRMVNTLVFGTGGNDIQIRGDLFAFSEVTHCAWETGEFGDVGVTPAATVVLSGSPFAGPDTFELDRFSNCVDAGLDLGYTSDLVGTPVPSGLAPDIGAYERVADTATTAAPSATHLLVHPVVPNPANPRARIAFSLPHEAFVRVRIHDLAGRRISTLLEGRRAAGRHELVWDGTDDAGRTTASGVYLVRVESAREASSAKLLLVR